MSTSFGDTVQVRGEGRRERARRVTAGWFRRVRVALRALTMVAMLGWGTLAIFYSNLPWTSLRPVLALVFLVLGVWAVWVSGRSWTRPVFVASFAAVFIWWITIRPSHDRPWRPEVAVMPRAVVEGDRIRITGFRNFNYQSRDSFTPRFEEREFLLSHLTSIDFFISYWRPGPVAHTFVSFVFDNAPPLCISIETRPEVGESFSPVGSLFKQFELIYVVGDERDLVGVRTHHRGEEVYLYRLRVTPEGSRRLLLEYLARLNQLADRPEWYHLLKNSCTVNIVRYANAAGRTGGPDIRFLLNGYADRALFREGLIDTMLTFGEARAQARIADAATAADLSSAEYSQLIRTGRAPAPP